MSRVLLLLLVISSTSKSLAKLTGKGAEKDSPAPPPSGKSFFLFGGIIQKIRRRWFGYNDPISAPLYAGPAYPLYGYYNCPIFGCNPTQNYRPLPYEQTYAYHHPTNWYNANIRPSYIVQQAPQQQQQSSVIIYQNGPDRQGYYVNHEQPAGGISMSPPILPMPSLTALQQYPYGITHVTGNPPPPPPPTPLPIIPYHPIPPTPAYNYGNYPNAPIGVPLMPSYGVMTYGSPLPPQAGHSVACGTTGYDCTKRS